MTATGFEKRIAEAAPHLSRSKCQRLALKLAKRAERMHDITESDLDTEEGFYRALRILGIHGDATARKSVAPEFEPTRHISERLPGELINRQEEAA